MAFVPRQQHRLTQSHLPQVHTTWQSRDAFGYFLETLFVKKNNNNRMVAWCSWLSHLLYTEKVFGSNPDAIIAFCIFLLHGGVGKRLDKTFTKEHRSCSEGEGLGWRFVRGEANCICFAKGCGCGVGVGYPLVKTFFVEHLIACLWGKYLPTRMTMFMFARGQIYQEPHVQTFRDILGLYYSHLCPRWVEILNKCTLPTLRNIIATPEEQCRRIHPSSSLRRRIVNIVISRC